MNNRANDFDLDGGSAGSGIKIGDIYFIFFRHKWKIMLLLLLGLMGAAGIYFLSEVNYRSEAKLLIRYVLETRSVNVPDDSSQIKSPDSQGENILNSEIEILKSLDLAMQVARLVGPERILASGGGGNDLGRAAAVVRRGMKVGVPRPSNIIQVSFEHSDRQIVQPVLTSLVEQYKVMHLEIHRPESDQDNFLTSQKDQYRDKLTETENQLRQKKAEAGVISLEEDKKAYMMEISQIRADLRQAEAELASVVASLQGTAVSGGGLTNDFKLPEIPLETVEQYVELARELKELKRKRQEASITMTSLNPVMIQLVARIENVEKRQAQLVEQNPDLATYIAVAEQKSGGGDSEKIKPIAAVALQAKINKLRDQLASIQAEAAAFELVEKDILELERQSKMYHENYIYYNKRLEAAKLDVALGPGRVSNIKDVQKPSPASSTRGDTYKFMGFSAAGGLILGLGLAFLIELFLDPTVKRPGDLESRMRMPILMTIPRMKKRRFVSRRKKRRVAREEKKARKAGEDPESALSTVALKGGHGELMPWDEEHPLKFYFEAMRDKLVADFDLKNLDHKPKLVAVTSCGHGAGVSTLATGLAASLSETGGGSVLLVDMTTQNGTAHPLYKGKPGCALPDALGGETRDMALMHDNLYVATAQSGEKLRPVLPRAFSHLMPKMKASDFDYIIFDMPPMSQVSSTGKLAGFMDTVLVVVESEETNQDFVKKSQAMLESSNADYNMVLNKYRRYVPEKLDQEF